MRLCVYNEQIKYNENAISKCVRKIQAAEKRGNVSF